MMAPWNVGLLASLLSMAAASLGSPPDGPQTGLKIAPCEVAEFHQFDFWIGEWEVWTERLREAGGPPARSRISSIQEGCAILEEYSTSAGYTGTSFSFYDKADRRWHQAWVDNQGAPIRQSGGLRNGSMVMEVSLPDGATDRTTWTPLEDGRVRQTWERSKDGGTSWEVIFDGFYEPRAVQ